MPVSIVEQEGRRTVNSQHAIPSRFPARAWMLDGEWDAGRRVWYFAAGDVERVRALCREVCGTADSSEPFPAGIGDNSRPLAGPSRQPCEVGKRFLGEAVYQTWATFAWRMQNADTCGSRTESLALYREIACGVACRRQRSQSENRPTSRSSSTSTLRDLGCAGGAEG